MAKHFTKRGAKEAAVVVHASATRRVRLGEVLVQARTALREIVVGAGLQVPAQKVEEFLSRPVEVDLPVLMIDGTALEDHVLIVAMGIDSEGAASRCWGSWKGARRATVCVWRCSAT